jgi:hypothetical protein
MMSLTLRDEVRLGGGGGKGVNVMLPVVWPRWWGCSRGGVLRSMAVFLEVPGAR